MLTFYKIDRAINKALSSKKEIVVHDLLGADIKLSRTLPDIFYRTTYREFVSSPQKSKADEISFKFSSRGVNPKPFLAAILANTEGLNRLPRTIDGKLNENYLLFYGDVQCRIEGKVSSVSIQFFKNVDEMVEYAVKKVKTSLHPTLVAISLMKETPLDPLLWFLWYTCLKKAGGDRT